MVYNSIYVLVVYNFIILLHMQLQLKSERFFYYLAQFNITYQLVLGCCTSVIQSFKNKYYVTAEDILNLQL